MYVHTGTTKASRFDHRRRLQYKYYKHAIATIAHDVRSSHRVTQYSFSIEKEKGVGIVLSTGKPAPIVLQSPYKPHV